MTFLRWKQPCPGSGDRIPPEAAVPKGPDPMTIFKPVAFVLATLLPATAMAEAIEVAKSPTCGCGIVNLRP